MALDENTRNNLVAQMSGEFLRSFAVSDKIDSFMLWENQQIRERACHAAIALAEDYCNALDLHLSPDKGNHH